VSEFGLSRIRFVFHAHASGFGITLRTPGRLAFPFISYLFRTRFACRHYIVRPSLQGNIQGFNLSPSARTVF